MTLPLTIAICSNRPTALRQAVTGAVTLLGKEDYLLVVLDVADPRPVTELLGPAALDHRVRVLRNGGNRGLSYSRNRAVKECPTRHLLFLDDDIVAGPAAVEAVRGALEAGAAVVGTRITAQLAIRRPPWFLTQGQLHYLGCHHPSRPATIWGGCFALDIAEARLLGACFDERLGRTGTSLASAEDTTFVNDITRAGGTAAVVHDVSVEHMVVPERLRLAYLLRRAYWQGRSEVRRGSVRAGLRKEWRRNRPEEPTRTAGRTALALLYTAAVATGIARESVAAVTATGSLR